MTKRITIKTQDDAIAYLLGTGFNVSYFKTDDAGNHYEEHRITCKRCGGAGYYPTPRHGACYECNGNPPNYLVRTGIVAIAKKARKAELAAAARTRKADAKNAVFNAKRDAKAVKFDAAYPTLRADLADYLPLYNEDEGYNVAKKEHRILNDMAGKLAKWGDMSEGAASFAQKLLDDESAPKETIEEGKRVISGTVVKCEWRETQWGSSYKVSVKLDDGTGIVWGTLPGNVEEAARHCANYSQVRGFDIETIVTGAAITFSSTITRSDKSTDFGFFKRPTKAFALFSYAPPAPPTAFERGENNDGCEFCGSFRHASEDCPAEAAFCRMSDDR